MSQANIYNLTRTTTLISQSTGGGGGIITPIPPLDEVLSAGNSTGQSNLVVDNDISIVYQGGIQITNNASYPAASSANTGIAIGDSATLASASGSISIGNGAIANGTNSTAIGNGAFVNHNNSTAIGQGVSTTTNDQIMLGQNYQLVQVPGNLYAEQWQGGMAHNTGSHSISYGDTENLIFNTVDYANDITGFSPVSNPSLGQIRLMRLNSMYTVSCSMRISSGTLGGMFKVLLAHFSYSSGAPVVKRLIATTKLYDGNDCYVSLSGTVLTDSNVNQFMIVTVENVDSLSAIVVDQYYAAGIRAN